MGFAGDEGEEVAVEGGEGVGGGGGEMKRMVWEKWNCLSSSSSSEEE